MQWKRALLKVLLIVIGVLLALAVNNWNTSRQERALEASVLRQLRSSIAEDLARLDSLSRMVQLRAERMDSLRVHLERGVPFGDPLDAEFGAVIRFWGIQLNRSPYEALKARGLSLVSNDSLRMRIIELYDLAYLRLEQSQADDRAVVLDVVRPYYLSHFHDIQFGDQATPHNCRAVADNPYFRNVLAYRRTSLDVNMIGPLDVAMRSIASLMEALDTATGLRGRG